MSALGSTQSSALCATAPPNTADTDYQTYGAGVGVGGGTPSNGGNGGNGLVIIY